MLGLKRFLLADEQSFVPRSLASTDGACGHTGSSAIPPSASLYRERMTLVPTEHSGVAQECARDRPLLAQSCHSLVCPLLGAEWTSDFRTFRSVADPKAEVNLVWLLTTLIDIAHEKFSMPGHKGAPWRGRILG
jgi:hypothetical protein